MSNLNLSPVESQITSLGTTEDPVAPGRNTTDVVYQEVRLYIEGVQIPFEAISITQAMGQLPTAEIQVPPQSGLMDICRYYEPKVHVFYRDVDRGGLRLLFWGHLVGSSFRHSRAGSGSASIQFKAIHKNRLLRQLTLDYSGYLNQSEPGFADQGSNMSVNKLGSQYSIQDALKGISGVQTDPKDKLAFDNSSVSSADTTKLMQSHAPLLPRLKGMASVAMNFWNQLKQATFQQSKFNSIMSGLYIPLIEDGLGYFKRMSGHTSLESLLDGDRQQICLHSGNDAKIIIPPVFKLNLTSAVQAKISVDITANAMQFSGETTDFGALLESFYYNVGYEVITLASPSEVPVDPAEPVKDYQPAGTEYMAVETIVKPQMPFYYSPVCNVIYPKMFHTIQVNQEEEGVPTRVTAVHDSMPTPDGIGVTYRGPHSVREAVSYAASMSGNSSVSSTPSLLNTLSISYHAPGRYEQGRGVNHLKIALPWWLQLLTRDEASKSGGTAQPGTWPDQGTEQYNSMIKFMAAWQARNGYDVIENGGTISLVRNPDKDGLNPYSPTSGTQPYQATLFTSVDYEFTKALISSRSGMVDCVFNPYIVPGYPMDVLDDSPNHPSFHAMCSSVTHTITASSIGTTVGMVAVQTYAELSNYYVPPAPPWLQTTLNLVSVTGTPSSTYGSTVGLTVKNAGSLLFNPDAKDTADLYYQSTLGVRAADPSTLIDWTTGQIIPQSRFDCGIVPNTKTRLATANGGDANDYNTVVGNLRLASRPIESKDSIEYKFDLSFVDLLPQNYNNSVVRMPNPKLDQDNFLEPGSSPFLDYMETVDFIQTTQGITVDNSSNGLLSKNYVSRRTGVE